MTRLNPRIAGWHKDVMLLGAVFRNLSCLFSAARCFTHILLSLDFAHVAFSHISFLLVLSPHFVASVC